MECRVLKYEAELKDRKISLFFTFIIVTMPIINNYSSPLHSIGISEFILLIFIPVMIFDMVINRITIKPYGYWLFWLYGILISLVMVAAHSDFSAYNAVIRLLRDTFYACVIFLFAQKYFNLKYALNLYKYLSIMASTYLILQCISFYVFHYTLPWILHGISLNYTITDTSAYSQLYKNFYGKFYFRATSVFLEPAQFAQFVAPCLALTLFPCSGKKRIDYRIAVFFSISLLMSTSANGYAFTAVIWIVWYLYNCFSSKYNVSIIAIFISGVLAVTVVILLYKYNSLFNLDANRIINIGDQKNNSANMRVLKGFYIFDALDSVFKIFGIGFGNYDSFVSVYPITAIYDVSSEYMSSLSYILVSSGIIGLCAFLSAICAIFKKVILPGKILIILLLIMFLSSSIYSSPMYLVIFAFILSMPPKANKYMELTA